MALTLLTVQKMVAAGLEVTTVAAAAGGNSFKNDGYTYLQVTNGGGGSITVTVESRRLCSQGGDHNLSVVVAAAKTIMIGRLNPRDFNDESSLVDVTYSGVTSVTVAAVSMAAEGR